MTGLRSRLLAGLGEGDVLLPQARRRRVEQAVATTGQRWLPVFRERVDARRAGLLAAAVAELRLPPQTMPRLLGWGFHLTAGLADLARTPAGVSDDVARLGGLFNLGITLFDTVCDEWPVRRRALVDQLSGGRLQSMLSGAGDGGLSGDAAVDLLITVIGLFCRGFRSLTDDDVALQGLSELLERMYRAELATTAHARRDTAPSNEQVWQLLCDKSTLPMQAMAQLALLPCASATSREPVLTAARLAGEAMWVVDDLADLTEDHRSGLWSRPWWLLAQQQPVPSHLDDAVALLGDSGVVEAEVTVLRQLLLRLSSVPRGRRDTSFATTVQAVVGTWLDEVPD